MQTPQVVIQDETPSEIGSGEDSLGSNKNNQIPSSEYGYGGNTVFGEALIPLAQKTTQTAVAVKNESAAITSNMHKQVKQEQEMQQAAQQQSAAECYMDPGDDMATPGSHNTIGGVEAKVKSFGRNKFEEEEKRREKGKKGLKDNSEIHTGDSNLSDRSMGTDLKGIMNKQNEMVKDKDKDKNKDDDHNEKTERTRSKGLDEFLKYEDDDDDESIDVKMEGSSANLRRRAFAKDSKIKKDSRRSSDVTPNLFEEKSERSSQQVQNNRDWVSKK